MKILFIYSSDGVGPSSKPLRSWTKVQFGISYLSSMLKAHGHETGLLVLGSDNKWKQNLPLITSLLDKFDPRIVCFTAVFSQYSFIEKVARFIRDNWPEKFLVIGGVHATLNPELVTKGPFDALCVGEGEYPILELCNQLETEKTPCGISNLWFKSADGEIIRTEPRDFLKDLDVLPFPDRQMWKPWINDNPDDEITMLVGRGCPYDCTYCSNHAIRKVSRGKYVRMRSPENIIQEITSMYDAYSKRKIFLEAEAIALDKKWAFELCDKLKDFNRSIGNAISYGCNFRVSSHSVDEDLFTAFEKANFYKINIGLESGSERVRREVLKRNYSNADFLNAVSIAKRHGLAVNVYNLIGIPGESMRDHMETVRINHLCQPDDLCTSIFFPYPGTELYGTCIAKGLINSSVNKTTRERRKAVLDLPDFSRGQIQRAYRLFARRVYKGRFPWWKNLLRSVYNQIPSRARTIISHAMIRVPVMRGFREILKVKLFGPDKVQNNPLYKSGKVMDAGGE